MAQAIDTVIRTFEWFNEFMADPDHVITAEEVERHFTPDARMIANGRVTCEGIEGHFEHFKELQAKLKSARVQLPLVESITNSDEAAAYYKIDMVAAANDAGGIVHDSALWRIRDGKIALMVESFALEGDEFALELDSHT
jgi:hypothetical protein